MTLNTTKTRRTAVAVLAPAACILFALLVFVGPGQQDAFAAALEHLRAAQTIACHMTMLTETRVEPTADAPPKLVARAAETMVGRFETRLWTSVGGVSRRDNYQEGRLTSTSFVSADGDTLLVDYAEQTYERFAAEVDPAREQAAEATAARPQPEVQILALAGEPERLLAGLRRLEAGAAQALPPREIDGQRALGYELPPEAVGLLGPLTSAQSEASARLWVAADSGLPLRLECSFELSVPPMKDVPLHMTTMVQIIYDRFELDPELPADWLVAAVPEGYTEAEPSGPKMTVPTEADFLAGLRTFSELAGRYPNDLSGLGVSQEMAMVIARLIAQRNVAEQRGEDTSGMPEREAVSQALSGLRWYAWLEMTGRQPEYFGRSVEPGAAGEVLMRYEAEDGSARIIYGDLRTEVQAVEP